eukprot:5599189-Pyramimonas_sp.AAC.1
MAGGCNCSCICADGLPTGRLDRGTLSRTCLFVLLHATLCRTMLKWWVVFAMGCAPAYMASRASSGRRKGESGHSLISVRWAVSAADITEHLAN